MQNSSKFLIIGEVYTDVHLNELAGNQRLLRLGGIFHTARAMDALKQQYDLAYIAPGYLKESIESFKTELNASSVVQIGDVKNCPNVMLITDSIEVADQGYNDLLREQSEVAFQLNDLRILLQNNDYSDILIYPGNYSLIDLLKVIKIYKTPIHIDFQYGINHLIMWLESGILLETFIISTSSSYFLSECLGSSEQLIMNVGSEKAKGILLKENRGGSRFFSNGTVISTPAFLTETVHSVGVGDCFNSTFLSNIRTGKQETLSLKIASYIASWYSSTWDHTMFKKSIENLPEDSELEALTGTSLTWEDRKKHHVYIAAPDFPDVDVRWIDKLSDSLTYHNFTPHRPVKENGLIRGNESLEQQMTAYINDVLLLEKCSILVAVLLNDDPGTYVEIGWMAAKGKSTILFDPYKQSRNLFLRKTVNQICYTLDDVIKTVYELIAKNEQEILDAKI
ncbi:nucleoside 2-deoxyribosyltransferase [Paenibacillus sp. Marseille-P2973]|uniref:nucleoside 2-deoxyribosyltransferase n=1 Tax=Paenibacillus sp. Marseille-P2973 TaxID=1871032 RepID=UPI001B39A217|nr:nucleoside 2-deoxyribosyltransferase [Paenibacillus sp. Marseille-P2973]MBQ4900313.1 nucleoside 2-deoxyribosyltransferase [Paenibacillus sp. Marseille-P2973]